MEHTMRITIRDRKGTYSVRDELHWVVGLGSLVNLHNNCLQKNGLDG